MTNIDNLIVRFNAILDHVQIEEGAFSKFAESLVSEFRKKLDAAQTELADIRERREDSDEKYREMLDSSEKERSLFQTIKEVLSGDTGGLSPEDQKRAELLQFVGNISNTIGNTLVSSIQTVIGVVEDVYKQLKQSSPFLQAVESMFNLAMQLFFMPLGNKLAEVLLPAVVDMLDKVVSMWDAFDGKTLGEMFAYAIENGVQLIGEFFYSIGDQLDDQGGIIGSIGDFLKSLGTFIQNVLPRLIDIGGWIFQFIVENIPLMIGLITAFMTAHLASQIAIMTVIAASSFDKIGGAIAVAAGVGAIPLATGAVAGVAAGAVAESMFAEGGIIEPVDGGQLILAGEGGEREYIIPESKMPKLASSLTSSPLPANLDMSQNSSAQTVNITYNINGYTDNELKDIIRDTVNDQISKSRLRAGY